MRRQAAPGGLGRLLPLRAPLDGDLMDATGDAGLAEGHQVARGSVCSGADDSGSAWGGGPRAEGHLAGHRIPRLMHRCGPHRRHRQRAPCRHLLWACWPKPASSRASHGGGDASASLVVVAYERIADWQDLDFHLILRAPPAVQRRLRVQGRPRWCVRVLPGVRRMYGRSFARVIQGCLRRTCGLQLRPPA